MIAGIIAPSPAQLKTKHIHVHHCWSGCSSHRFPCLSDCLLVGACCAYIGSRWEFLNIHCPLKFLEKLSLCLIAQFLDPTYCTPKMTSVHHMAPRDHCGIEPHLPMHVVTGLANFLCWLLSCLNSSLTPILIFLHNLLPINHMGSNPSSCFVSGPKTIDRLEMFFLDVRV